MSDALARARRIAGEVAAVHADAVDRDARFPKEAIGALKAERLLGAMIPVELGGAGAPLAETLAICQALGRGCSATAMVYAMHQIQVACLVRHAAGSDWHRAFMRRVAGEQLLLASATTEAGIGGDVRSSICAVAVAGGRFSLEKNASVISYAADADAILATARRAADAPASDQAIVVIPKDGCRLERTGGWDTLGMRGTCSDGWLLRAEGDAAQIAPAPYADISAQTMLPYAHLTWAALWLGIASEAVGRARAYARAEARRKPGAPQGTRLAELAGRLQAMKAGVVSARLQYEAAQASADGAGGIGLAVAMNNLKTSASRQAVEIVHEALLVCGIAGYRNDGDYSLGRLLRDAHSAALMVHNDRIHANTAGLLLALKEDTGALA